MLGGELSTAGRISVARVSPLRIAPCTAARLGGLLDCFARWVAAAVARAREDDREALAAAAGVVGAVAHGRAPGAAGERHRREHPLVEQPRSERVELRAPHRQRALHGRGDVGEAVDRPDRRVDHVVLGDRELALVALVALAVAVRDRHAGREHGGQRGKGEHERLAGLAQAQVAGPRAERLRARAEGDERDARDEQPQRKRGGDAGPGLVDVAQDRNARRAAEQHRDAKGSGQNARRAEGYPLESGPARHVGTIPFVHTHVIGARRARPIQRLSARRQARQLAA